MGGHSNPKFSEEFPLAFASIRNWLSRSSHSCHTGGGEQTGVHWARATLPYFLFSTKILISYAQSHRVLPFLAFLFYFFGGIHLSFVLHAETGRQCPAHCVNLMVHWWCGKWKMSRDVKAEIATAVCLCGSIHHIFSSPFFSVRFYFKWRSGRSLANVQCHLQFISFGLYFRL